MSAIDRRQAIDRLVYWASIAAGIAALKQFYSVASAEQLQWQLRPLVSMLEWFSDLSFQRMNSGEWLDASHRISIVKSCAGINFLIISLLGYLWQRQEAPNRLRLLIKALLTAWLTALTANTLRILACFYGEHPLSILLALSDTDSHRLIGIAVYFLCLWGQLACHRRSGFKRNAVCALICYLGIALMIPLLRTWLLDLEPLDWQHAAWVVVVPLSAVVLGFGVNRYWPMNRRNSPSRLNNHLA